MSPLEGADIIMSPHLPIHWPVTGIVWIWDAHTHWYVYVCVCTITLLLSGNPIYVANLLICTNLWFTQYVQVCSVECTRTLSLMGEHSTYSHPSVVYSVCAGVRCGVYQDLIPYGRTQHILPPLSLMGEHSTYSHPYPLWENTAHTPTLLPYGRTHLAPTFLH